MSDPDSSIERLRERVELQSGELGTAVQELGNAARDALAPARWIRERPLVCISGALAVGLWLGARFLRGDR